MMSTRWRLAVALLALLLPQSSLAAEKPDEPAAPAVPLEAMQVVWSKTAFSGALDIFPHPVLSRRAILATDKGLRLSDDWGKTFPILEQASADRVGLIRSVAFDPDRAGTFLAAGDKGVWLSTDAGKTFTQVGSASRGMAADVVVGVWVYPGDPSNRTLLAAHGAAATGLSISYDGGEKWQVLYSNVHVRHAALGLSVHEGGLNKSFLLVAAAKDTPDIVRVYHSPALGEELIEQLRDILVTDATVSLNLDPPDGYSDRRAVYFATSDADLYRIEVGAGVVPGKLAVPGVASWASIGATHSYASDVQLLYGYDTAKLGLVLSWDGFKRFTTGSRGLPVGPLIREGAKLRAAAGASVFYATVNGSLYLGTVWGPGMILTGAEVTPPIVSFSRDTYLRAREKQRQEISLFPQQPSAAAAAKGLRESIQKVREAFFDREFTVRAKVLANNRPASVSVDLAAVDGADAEPMFDDGQHQDGASGDGVYGAQFRLNLAQYRNHRKRNHWPGSVSLPITVTSATGKAGAIAAVASIRARSDDAVVWDEPWRAGNLDTEGGATAEMIESDNGIHSGRKALRLTVNEGPWSVALRRQGDTASITAYAALSFWVKVEGNPTGELFVQLQDEPTIGLTEKTRPVAVVSGGYCAGGALADDWRQVSIPVTQLLAGADKFQPALFANVIFGGEGKSNGVYWIDSVRLLRAEPTKN